MFLDNTDDLKIIKNDSNKYLGFHEIKEGSCVLSKIVEFSGKLSNDVFELWITKNNLNETTDIEISNPINVSTSDLTAEDKSKLKRMKEIFVEAKEKATNYIVNTVFVQLLEKLGD